ncbi:potassium transporter KefB [Spirosoma sp. BT702]|uniref:Potassium transporter KefB n=1 Tax=Spirosoma profusum TaxID=2771354 RepID=A0A927AQE2_9BACT|nr:potassium transporter KefB [Spirosoma profusum]MBD2700196.1 potassium transporter KefB [Spirosoma profusum]
MYELKPLDVASLSKKALFGAAIGLVLICFFLSNVNHPNPDWPKFWMVRPLIIVPLAGACGGAFYYFTNYLPFQKGWKKIAINVLSLFVFLIGLWMGIVLGLDGTLWN